MPRNIWKSIRRTIRQVIVRSHADNAAGDLLLVQLLQQFLDAGYVIADVSRGAFAVQIVVDLGAHDHGGKIDALKVDVILLHQLQQT